MEQQLISTFFTKVVTYDINLKYISCIPLTNGKCCLRLLVNAMQFEKGSKQPMPFKGNLTFAFFGKSDDFRSYKIDHHRTILDIIVLKRPSAVEIDPFYSFLDNDRANNRVEIN